MSLDCRELTAEDEALWQILITSSPEGTIFHSDSWLKAIEKVYQLTLKRWLVLDANFKVQGGAYLFVRHRSGFKLGYAPPSDTATPYGGILVVSAKSQHTRKQESHLKEILNLLTPILLMEKTNGVFLTLSPSFKDIRYYQWNHWKTGVLFTYKAKLIDGDLFTQLDSTARNTIRKAEKMVEVRVETDPSAFYKLYRDTYQRQGKNAPVPEEFLLEVLKLFQEKGWARLFMAYTPEGEPAAGAVWLRDDKRSYYWLAASNSELARTTGAPALVLWNLFLASQGEVAEIDLVGANTEAIAFFKAMFNPKLESYYRVEYTDTTYRLAVGIRNSLAKFMSKKSSKL